MTLTKSQKTLLLAVAAASLLANLYLAWTLSPAGAGRPWASASSLDQIEVIRTPGGLLQVSTLRSAETFQATQDHDLMGLPLGKTTTQIRVPATFQYHVALAPEWKITRRDKALTVVAPRVRPTLPVAIDTTRMETLTSGAWSVLTGPANLAQLQQSISPGLAAKAASPAYIALQREAARKTVTEFVTKWVLEQQGRKPSDGYTVRVLFADEPIEALGTLPASAIAAQ
ncbi:MAG: hypothetical protein JWR60_2450 [Polaromonas sp.]|nr:hypothetical protein [Polaromonas sp.]